MFGLGRQQSRMFGVLEGPQTGSCPGAASCMLARRAKPGIASRVRAAQGLSHYLEHMLFMGSEGFPDENSFDAYLSTNGGSSNACTENVSSE